MSKDFKGFTLAEVLLTLAIVGIVAALTIPSLLNSTNDTQIKTSWKKAFNVASQAWQKAIMNNGGSAPGQVNPTGDATSSRRWQAFLAELNVVKFCNTGNAFGNCWAKNGVKNNSHVGGCTKWQLAEQNDNEAVVTADGMYWMNYKGDSNNYWAYIAVDVNGDKAPNEWNKDVFSFALTDDNAGWIGVCSDLGGVKNSLDYLK